jgi:dTDP-4-dehydrorhamnose 3,5-epimerase
MNVIQTKLPGVVIIEPRVFGDERGFFIETWQQRRYAEAGLPDHFVQDNLSFSQRGILRGLHYQHPQGQGKLVYVLQGEVYDVAVDIRVGSPTFGQWEGVTLSAENKRQLFIPPGFAHGFCVTGELALFVYKCSEYYNPALEGGVRWDDPEIGINWPVSKPTLSDKDRVAPLLKAIPHDRLPA